MSLLLLRKTDTLLLLLLLGHKNQHFTDIPQHKQKIPAHTHSTHTASPCQGRSTSIAAVIIMISSNEGATGVSATRLLPLTQPVITTFLSRLTPCNSLPITALSGCPVTGLTMLTKAPPKKPGGGTQRSRGWVPIMARPRGRHAADEVCNTTCTLWRFGQR